jgi:protein-S-isoprenylcysteine O-methyltransferase Ste14
MSKVQDEEVRKRIEKNPDDLFPYRGQPRTSMIGPLIFVIVRTSMTISVWFMLHAYLPLKKANSAKQNPSLSTLPKEAINQLSILLDLEPGAAILFTEMVIVGTSFILYAWFWRRERLPILGLGANALFQSFGVGMVDFAHILFYVYGPSLKSKYESDLFGILVYVFIFGIILHQSSDAIKFKFKIEKNNIGKVIDHGPWSIVRHPNFVGFWIWRAAFTIQSGGAIWFSILMIGLFGPHFWRKAVPSKEEYLAERYKTAWKQYEKKVPYKMIPLVW